MTAATQVFVLAAPGRVVAHERLRASLAESDVGDYRWCEHPPGLSVLEHWSETFLKMADAESDLVILLEDDALVNRHIIENVESWCWPHDRKRFGAGWLYSPGGFHAGHDCWYSKRIWHGSVGVLYWRDQVRAIHDSARDWMLTHGPAIDFAVSQAVHVSGRKIRQHGPPLVEHQRSDVPSTLGHDAKHCWANATTRGTFRAEWRRPARDSERIGNRRL